MLGGTWKWKKEKIWRNVCVYFRQEQTSVEFLPFFSENRKTVCFLLLSKLPLTHFRYSINLIAIPLSTHRVPGREKNISKQFLILMFAMGNCFPNCFTFCWWKRKMKKEIFWDVFILQQIWRIFKFFVAARNEW